MASHHHPCHHPAATTTTSYCHCYYTPYPPCHHHPPPPPDPHILYHPPPPQPHIPYLHPHFQERSFHEEGQSHATVSALLRRIAALESALGRRSSSSSSHSLRDAAARTIQAHFRAFLLRRSRTLRQLKELASIKSRFSVLKSSVSDKSHLDYDVVYRAAVDLLLKLNAIQGRDPMIRDGKRSIHRELNKFLDFIEGFGLERRGISGGVRLGRTIVKSKVADRGIKIGNVNARDLKRANVDKLRGLVERIDKLAEKLDDDEEEDESEVIENPNVFIRKDSAPGIRSGVLVKPRGGAHPKVKKSVSFEENGKVYRVLRRNLDDDGKREFEDDLLREVEEIGVSSKEAEDEDDDDEDVEAHSENGASLASSDGEKDSSIYLRSEDNKSERDDEGGSDDFTFSAPLPEKMETRFEDSRKKIAK